LKHKIWYDAEKDILRERLIGSFTEDDVSEYLALMKEVYGSCKHRHVIVDVSEARQPFYESKTQEKLIEGAGRLRYFDEKVAFLKAAPDIRSLIIEVVETMRLRGKPLRTRFFETEEEALAWLREE
jgi:hypothetical protein